MARYLVTGGAGFIGSHLVEELLWQEHEVLVLDDLSNSSWDNIENQNFTKLRGSVEDEVSISNLDGIFHLATHPRSFSLEDPIKNIEVNCKGTIRMLELAKKNNCKLVFTSNSGIVSKPARLPITENTEDHPTTPYDANKLVSEYYCKIYNELYGVKSLVFRLGSVYGPRQKVVPELNWFPVISTMIQSAKEKNLVWITGSGLQSRDFIYVDDVVNCLRYGMGSPFDDARKFLVGTGVSTTLLEVKSIIELIAKHNLDILWKPDVEGGIVKNQLDSTNAYWNLKWYPHVTISEGIEKLWNIKS